tara:strand:+ start:156 stop:1208 length:1053 start_codon:yes stop_codon:yes gene_type:complete
MGLVTAYAQNIKRYNDSDPFDDRNKNTVVVSGTNLHDSYDDPFLVWRCDGNNKFEIYVKVDEHKWLDSDPINLRYRFDAQQPQRETWGESTKGTAAFARSKIEFTAQAITSNKVVFGIKDFSDEEHVVEFRLTGLKSYLQQLGCVSWEEPPPPPPRKISRGRAFPGPPKQVHNYLEELLARQGESFSVTSKPALSMSELNRFVVLRNTLNANNIHTISSQNFELITINIDSTLPRQRELLNTKKIETGVVITALDEKLKLVKYDGSYIPMVRFGVQAKPSEVYKVVREVLGDIPITEKLNIVRVEGLDIHLFPAGQGTYVAFDGINENLYLELKKALKAKHGYLFPNDLP